MKREYLYDRPGTPGHAGSAWLAGRERPQRPAVDGDFSADVAVIGAGLVGVLTAVRLAEKGSNVALIEGRRVCGDVTGHTSAKATAQHGLVSRSVSEHSTIPWVLANVAALGRLEALAGRVAPDAFERMASHAYTQDSSAMDDLRREAALYDDAGLAGGVLDVPPEGIVAAVRLEGQALIDPVALCDGLLDNAPGSLTLFEGSIVRALAEERHGVALHCDGGVVHADRAVCATNHPAFDTLLYSTRLFPYRTYALEIEVGSAPPAGMWYGLDYPHLAWRPVSSAMPMRLVVSGVRHKAGQGGDERVCYRDLEAECRTRFGPLEVLRHWSTQDNHSPDGLPIIGRMVGRERVWVASGFNGWGMTTAEVAAEVMATQLAEENHDLGEMLAPARLSTKGLGETVRENLDVAAEAIQGETTRHEDPETVVAGEGATMRTKSGHAAVMRDADGTLHLHDAHCQHLRCEVEFNEAEGTWDCPCHGSRYLGDGSWLHGPARRGLEPLDQQ